MHSSRSLVISILSPEDFSAISLTLELASASTLVLLIAGTPLAWWLARGSGRLRTWVAPLVALPLVLPPTVIGFYLLVFLSPSGAVGQAMERIGLPSMAFSFSGLLLASCIYSLPFVVQPLDAGFRALDRSLLEAAATLRAKPLERFLKVALPLCRPSYLTAAILGFAHTVGEFGVVLMVGGNIPGRTRVLSVAIYDHVEALRYSEAHRLAAGLIAFSFLILLILYRWTDSREVRR